MKKIMMAAVAAAFLGSPALADVDINVPAFSFTATGQQYVHEVILGPGDAVNGFSFIGTVWGISDNGTWASDTRLDILGPSGSAVSIGGFPAGLDLDWDFQGSGSNLDGTYASGPHFVDSVGDPVFNSGGGTTMLEGTWTFTFTQTWFGAPVELGWNDVTITLHQIPAPGALALIGVAGMFGARRRR